MEGRKQETGHAGPAADAGVKQAMNYLLAGELENYGLEAATPTAWVTAASALIEAHCRRPTLGVTVYTERLRVPSDRGVVRVTYLPLVTVAPATSAVVSARGRYGWPRRGEFRPVWRDYAAPPYEYALEVVEAFGLPGAWTAIDPASIDCNPATGELTFLPNLLGLPFNEVEVTYNAGLATAPEAVKVACAQIVRNAMATPALTLKAGTLDRMHLEYFAGTLVDNDVAAMLAPWVAQKVA